MKLSVCMIVKNEELTLRRILSQIVSFADEIIIVDTGSVDSTKSIAFEYTDKVYDFKWVDDFSLARNFAFDKAVGDYLMWLDADDYIDNDVCDKINELKHNLTIDCVMCPYAVSFEGDKIIYWYYRERIMKNCPLARFEGFIHEAVAPFGNVVYNNNIVIKHKKEKPTEKGRNLKIFENALKNGKILDARLTYYYGRELFYNDCYEDAFKVLNDFISMKGLIVNLVDACMILSDLSCRLKNGLEEYYLFKALCYSVPTSELACKIGHLFFDKGDFETAIFWYETALRLGENAEKGAFIDLTFSDYVPNIQLCVCYYKLGDVVKSIKHNNRALKAMPKSDIAKQNKKFLKLFKESKK